LIEFNDLKKILEDVSPDRSGVLNFFQFSRWMGPSIQENSSLNFRHDSSFNPEFAEYQDANAPK
jgi:hypothetical protein